MRPFIIFSVFRPNKNNLTVHSEVKELLKELKIKFIEAVGCYKGHEELSLIVDSSNLEFIKSLAKVHEQESILVVGQKRTAALDFLGGVRETIGKWTEVNKTVALSQDAYTKIGSKYFICR